MAKINWENTKLVLDIFGKNTTDRAKKNLNSPGPLSDSIGYELKLSPNSFQFDIKMLEYGNYQDKGVRGTRKGNWTPSKPKRQNAPRSPFKYVTGPGTKTILESMVNKPSFRTRDLETGQFTPKTEANKNQAAFLIARSIGRFGIPRKGFMSDAIETYGRTLTKNLSEAWVKDQRPFINSIKNAFKTPI